MPLPLSNAILKPPWSFINWIQSHESGYGQLPFLNGPIEPFAPNFVRRLLSAVKLQQRSLCISKFSASIHTVPTALVGRPPTTSLFTSPAVTLTHAYTF